MKVKNNYNRCEVIPYLVFFGLILIRHCFIDANFGDDLWFSTVLNDKTLGTYLHWRYTTWSSRLIVEMILIFFAEKNIWLWRIADSLVFLLLMYSLSEVFIEKGKKKYGNWILAALILCYPIDQLSSAGWIATTLNYLWPLSFGAFALIVVKKNLMNEKVSGLQEFATILCMIYAANTEQMGAILFCVYLIFGIYLWVRKRKVYKVLIFNMLIAAMSLAFILTCPGNKARAMSELIWFNGFESLSLLEKLGYGYVSTTTFLIENINIVYLIFLIVMALYMIESFKEKSFKVVGTMRRCEIFSVN